MKKCREPEWGIPLLAKVMRKEAWQYTKAGSGLRGPPGFSWASTPKTRVCLPYCIMLSTYSSDIMGGYPPPHFTEKSWLRTPVNKSPGCNKSVSVQKLLWWLSSLPDKLIQTLTTTHVIVNSLPTVRDTRHSKLSKYRVFWEVRNY